MFSCSPVEAVNVPPHDATAASRRTALDERTESLIGPDAIARSATRGLFSSLVAAAAGRHEFVQVRCELGLLGIGGAGIFGAKLHFQTAHIESRRFAAAAAAAQPGQPQVEAVPIR